MSYRFYLTEGIKMIAENTAHFAGGSAFKMGFYDLLNPQKTKVETRSANDIINNIKQGLGD
mgnify:CR=1 FL=1